MPYEVAVTGWTNLMGCDSYEGDATLNAVQEFRDAFRGNKGDGPEQIRSNSTRSVRRWAARPGADRAASADAPRLGIRFRFLVGGRSIRTGPIAVGLLLGRH